MAIVVVVCFYYVSINISLNFICFIIENRLYYLDCICKLLKTKLMNLGYLELFILLPSPWSLLYGDLFSISSIRLLVALLLLLAFNCFIYYLDGPDLLLIENLMNLDCLELLLLTPLLLVAPSCSFCSVPGSSICVCCACTWVVCFICICYARA